MSDYDLVKTLRMNYLFDFYQALLTKKQRSYLELFYLQDFSLSEIA
ncbi:MAG: DNA-binding protein, partial [Staphylococcus lugdunensis]|nr:DNA-binding protein [Staphylococcus lugdunensis]